MTAAALSLSSGFVVCTISSKSLVSLSVLALGRCSKSMSPSGTGRPFAVPLSGRTRYDEPHMGLREASSFVIILRFRLCLSCRPSS